MFEVTKFSFITAFLISNLFFVFFVLLSKIDKVILRIPLKVFVMMGALLLIRSFFPIETDGTIELISYNIYPAILHFLGKRVTISSDFSLQIQSILVIIWGIVAVCILGNKIFAYRCLIKRFDYLQNICNERYKMILNDIKVENNYKFDTILIVNKKAKTVLEYGYFRQIIFMPEYSYSDSELRYIFLHELEHFANKTNWIKLLITVLVCIFWWNPIMYLVKNVCSHLLELYCDSCVSKKLTKKEKIEYLSCLLQEMRRESSIDFSIQKFNFSSHFLWKSNLKQRFSIVLNYKRDRKLEIGTYCIIFALFIFSYGFVLQPAYRPPKEGLNYVNTANYYIECEDEQYILYVNEEPLMSFESLEEIEQVGLIYGR